ncbi:hypothetical protein TKK_0006530 [Trichogramma kaykai]|uniref:Salivary secreted peptide n=1 Tax=Trichogramma kaykai TaxID=54128 RepID=A0ABD2XCM5_9HYME
MVSPRLVLVCVLLAVVVETLAVTRPNDVFVGARIPGDRIIQRERIVKDASKIGRKAIVSKTFSGDGYSNITYIRALDQHTNGHGATATIISGGTGFKFVTMKFKSERFRGIDFVVELYGK